MPRIFQYNGQDVTLQHTEDREDDCTKLWHELVNSEGRVVHDIDWSPYGHIPEEAVELYLKLGCPTRRGIGPLNMEDLHAIQAEQDFEKQILAKKETLEQPDEQHQISIF